MSRSLKDWCYGLTARFVSLCIAPLPRRVALPIGVGLGTLGFWLARHERELAKAHLALSFEQNDGRVIDRWARRCFQNLGKNVIEFIQFRWIPPKRLHRFVAFEGGHHIEQALAQGKGAIILSAHFGNWELLAAAINANGYPMKPFVRRLRSRRLETMVRAYRQHAGYSSIEGGIREALRRLKANQLVGIVADVDTKVDGVFVDFFGRPAYTPSSPVAFALRTGAAILPTFIVRQSDNSHRAIVEPPLVIETTGDKTKDIVKYTQAFTKVIESYVRKQPEQWIWMHERWKRQPQN